MAGPNSRRQPHGLNPGVTILLTATSLLIVLSIVIATTQLKIQTMRVGSGVPGGTLAEITPSIVETLNAEVVSTRFEIVDSLGTSENIEGLQNGDVDIAIIYEGIKPRIERNSGLRTIARLYINPLHVIAAEVSGIKRFEDITREHRIGIPPPRVASYKRANDVLTHYGIYKTAGYDIRHTDNYLVAAHLLKTGGLDLAFFGGAVPIPSIDNYFVEDAQRFRFIPIDSSSAIAMRNPQYTVFSLPAMSYMGKPPFPRADTITIASIASLVGRVGVEEELGRSEVYSITKALFDSRSFLVNRHPYLQRMSEKFSSEEPEHPLFEGSADFYNRNKPIMWDALALYISSAFSVVFLVLTLISFATERRKRNRE